MPGLDADTLAMVLSTLQKYADKKLPEKLLLELDHKDEFPRKVLKELYDTRHLGLHLVFIPETFGGLDGGAYDIYRVSEVMAGIDLGIATGVLATFLGSDPITVGGTPEQQAHWMGRIAEEGLLVAYGATEPQAGSDLARAQDARRTGQRRRQGHGLQDHGAQAVDFKRRRGGYLHRACARAGRADVVRRRAGRGGLYAGQAGGKARHPGQQHRGALPRRRLRAGRPHDRRRRGAGLASGAGRFRLHPADGRRVRAWRRLGSAPESHPLFPAARAGRCAPLAEAGVHAQADRAQRGRLEAARAYIEWTAERIDGGAGNLQTEGAVAKYMATEAGNKAAEDSIQALGGYGYAKEYMVEKIKRDVRITTIYEGTSEIMEWTIARDRWQEHLKTRGATYRDWAGRLEALDCGAESGANVAALAMAALAAILERSRIERLTRNQHVLFRLGELIAWAETAAIFSERAVTKPTTAINLGPDTEKILARIYARQAAMKVAAEGLALVAGALPGAADDLAGQLRLPEVYAAQAGLVQDMDAAALKLNEAFPA